MVKFQPKEHYTMQDLVEIVSLLRDPQGGCPWDREQTHQSIRMNFIEETYEVIDAIDRQDAHLLQEELGDVLLQVALHSQMEAEAGRFTFDEVCDGICKKLVYRHPHVFGEMGAVTSGEALVNWELLKNKEKGRATAKDRLESVPHSFPALMRAAKLQKRAAAYGFDCENPQDALQTLKQQIAQLESALQQGQAVPLVGDVLFAATALCRSLKQDPEQALTQASDAFMQQVIRCEEMAASQGTCLQDVSDEQRNEFWQQAKQEQSSKT